MFVQSIYSTEKLHNTGIFFLIIFDTVEYEILI